MKKIILASFLISMSCFAVDTKFHFKDCVKVMNGFYKNCYGTVEYFYEPSTYLVMINCKKESLEYTFEEKDLESSKECKK